MDIESIRLSQRHIPTTDELHNALDHMRDFLAEDAISPCLESVQRESYKLLHDCILEILALRPENARLKEQIQDYRDMQFDNQQQIKNLVLPREEAEKIAKE